MQNYFESRDCNRKPNKSRPHNLSAYFPNFISMVTKIYTGNETDVHQKFEKSVLNDFCKESEKKFLKTLY
jgi:hypothetical protein